MRERPEVGSRGPRARCRRTAASTTPRSAHFPTPLSSLAHFTGLGRRGGGALAAYRGARRRSGPGRRRQRRLHAAPPRGARPGRRSSTRATGCTWRTSTSATASPSAAGSPGTSRRRPSIHVKGGTQRADSRPRLEPGLPLRHVPLLPQALRAPTAARPSTPPSMRGSRSSSPPPLSPARSAAAGLALSGPRRRAGSAACAQRGGEATRRGPASSAAPRRRSRPVAPRSASPPCSRRCGRGPRPRCGRRELAAADDGVAGEDPRQPVRA